VILGLVSIRFENYEHPISKRNLELADLRKIRSALWDYFSTHPGAGMPSFNSKDMNSELITSCSDPEARSRLANLARRQWLYQIPPELVGKKPESLPDQGIVVRIRPPDPRVPGLDAHLTIPGYD